MQRFWVACLLVAVGCSDDDRNKTTPDTELVEVPPDISNQGHVRILFHALGNANSFFCTLDGNNPVQCISPFEADVTDGAHTFAVAAALNANVDETPAMYAWRIDTVSPETTITSAPATLDNSTTPMFAFSGSDASTLRAGVTFECSLDGAPFAACASPLMLTVADGFHGFAVRAKDEAGNVDPSPAMHSWTIDATAPETAITNGPAAGATSGPTGAFEFSSPDATATFECAIDGAAFAACTSPHAFTLGDGAHTFAVRARDATNVDPSPAMRAWTVDATPPPVTITSAPADPSNLTTPMFAFTSTDTTATFECQIDGVVTFAACTSPFTSPALTDGSRTFRVRAKDPVGNLGTPATHTWIVDTIAPTVTFTSQPAALSNNAMPAVTFTTAGNPVTTQCRLDAGTLVACSGSFTVAAADGTHTITVLVTDAAGNMGSATTSMFVVDTMPPSVTITGQPAALSNDTTPTVTFTTAGSPVSTRCQLDGGALTACSGSFTPTAGDGSHTITIRVTDAAGNSGSATTAAFVIDTQAPSVTITGQPAALSNDSTPTVTFTTAGNPTSTQCQLDAGAFAACTSPFTISVADGTHTITIKVTDGATNSSTATTAAFVVDTVTPTVTFTQQPAALSNDTTPTVQFTTTDNPTTIECQVDGGAFAACTTGFTPTVAEGTHTITVRVADGAGNSSSATTAPFVVDLTAPSVTITGQPAALSNDNTPTVVFTTGGSPTSIQCRLDSGTLVTCTSPFTFAAVPDGTHTITVTVSDAAGNSASATTSAFVVDTVGPALAFVEQAPASWPVNYFDFTFTTGDATAVSCAVDGGTFATCSSAFTATVTYGTAHTVSVRGVDAAGNQTTITSAAFTPTPGLVLHYPWEQGNTQNTSLLKQRPSHSPDGSLAAAPFVGGWAGSALGNTVAAHTYAKTIRPLLSSPNGTYTVSFWIRSIDGADGTILSTATATGGIKVSLSGGAQLTVAVLEGTSQPLTTTIPTDRWVNVALRTTGPGKGLEVFVNGAARGTIATFNGFNTTQAANLTVGAFALFDIDDLRFYNTTFTTQEMCTIVARGFMSPAGGCVPLSPGFEIDFELNRVADTGAWQLPLSLPQATHFATHTLGGLFNLTTTFDWGYAIGGASFSANVAQVPGRSFSFEFVAGTAFGRIIDMTTACSVTGGGGLCGILVSYPDNSRIRIYTGTPTDQKTTDITLGLVANRFNNVVVTEQKTANGTTSLTVFINGKPTVIPITGGDIYARVRDDVRLVQTANLVVDEYEFWPTDLSADPELLCENGVDGEFDVVTGTCLLTYGP